MILDVLKLAIGAGTHVMKNRQKRKMLESDAAMMHAPVSYTHLTLPTNREV